LLFERHGHENDIFPTTDAPADRFTGGPVPHGIQCSHQATFTLPEQLIGVTQGFLEFTVEDYLATTQTGGRYEIQVNRLDPRLRMPLCSQQLTLHWKARPRWAG
jgi:hypothetical protein